jgi:protein-L-isoaspartate(D-aspartate) O-methyltransferase
VNPKNDFSSLRREMVARQIETRGITDTRLLDVMRKVPRHRFVPPDLYKSAYQDRPLPIGGGQTISQPYIVALMTSELGLGGDEKVLEIGTGSGYQAAILSELAQEVHTIERIPELAEKAKETFESLGYSNIFVHIGDGSLGWQAEALYDRIVVTAAAPKVPQPLLDQLEVGGKLIIPVGGRWRQVLELWEREEEGVVKNEVLPVVFVPLIGIEGWQDSL